MVICEDQQLFVTGDLDFSTVEKLWKESLPMLLQLHELKFDLSKVSSSNSAGIALLVEWIKYANREKKAISFANIPARMMSLAIIAGLEHLMLTPRVMP